MLYNAAQAVPLHAREAPAAYGEMLLVEAPAIALLQTLGWAHADLYQEKIGKAGTEGRESEHQVVLPRRLRAALERLNPGLPAAAYEQAVEQLSADRSRETPVNANRAIYNLLRDGVKVALPDDEGTMSIETLAVIDWRQPARNDFFVATQFWVRSDMYRRRCDGVGFINGLPLVFLEFKALSVNLKSAFDDNLRDYRGQSIPQLFHYNALIMLSNGRETKIGTLTSMWEHFAEWKRISSEEESARVSLETALRGIMDHARLLDMVENFTLFEEVRGGLVKKIAKNHQFLGVNKAIVDIASLKENQGKLGVFWHTQGSGKSLSMVFFTQKILRTLPGAWTFVVVTDRDELDTQIYKTFACTGATGGAKAQADSAAHLKELLAGNQRHVFTLIQKFRSDPDASYPVLSMRSDIIVMTDEAHRSEYGTFAMNMRKALPNAAFIGFTGTPLISGEDEKTRAVFGDYVSVYNFAQAVADGATVPLYYENRIPELQLTNDDLNSDLEGILESAALDDEQEKRLEREFGRQYHLITRDGRLETIAADIVLHFTGRGYRGKAMMVCIDKVTAVRMYDKVQAHWQATMTQLKGQLAQASGDHENALRERLALMASTDMAVVVSQSQNEVDELKAKGVDIEPHRRLMLNGKLEDDFKNPASNLRMVFVCAMWMTGFDVPTCSTLYLDKPMKAHTLMQAIARANRVAEGKSSGLIVDYIGILQRLQDALAIYARPGKGGTGPADVPVEGKEQLLALLVQALASAEDWCTVRGIGLPAIIAAQGFERIGLMMDAVDAIVTTDETRGRFLQLAGQVAKRYKTILPDASASRYAAKSIALSFLARQVKALMPPVDIGNVMSDIEALLDDSIATEGYRIDAMGMPTALINLSEIDFEALDAAFQTRKRQHVTAEQLKAALGKKLKDLTDQNPQRINFVERFQKLIDEYNTGSKNIDQFFNELKRFAHTLSVEEQRGVALGLSEEELVIFDILTRPDPVLTREQELAVRRLAKDLLDKLKSEKLILDWRLKQQARAGVQKTIRDLFRTLPQPYTVDLRQEKAARAYGFVYDTYPGGARPGMHA
ncbi:type I restriction endonuclease subunit R [Janthinobacterium sp. PC23-8]|uniref:type I restriction endonuclease subunit R n=1 Tax=Janthinobacterium sp. PC23-8 TaxID=2012679 RepID=UPI000B964D3C|nr:type I restriction endonuclease subunit R [Janthinobacterium sp. PC23-8]OYO31156.1 DEAD/DEAH box helicase [Janthinobacterium sp. PC23-8]